MVSLFYRKGLSMKKLLLLSLAFVVTSEASLFSQNNKGTLDQPGLEDISQAGTEPMEETVTPTADQAEIKTIAFEDIDSDLETPVSDSDEGEL
jgi:hypothetical protein